MRRLLLLSADALMAEDLPLLRVQPNFQKYMQGCAQARQVLSIYPTLTYPCHATLITGQYPMHHGVLNNVLPAPGNANPPWAWDRRDNKATDDLFFAAKRQGLTTASIFWPTTGNHPAIDWLIPEYWPQRQGESLPEAMRRMGTSEPVVSILKAQLRGRNTALHPEADDFAVDCACEIIRQFQPHLLCIHPVNIDEARHRYGVQCDRAEEAVRQIDSYLGQLCRALEDVHLLSETVILLTSDHGQRNVDRQVRLNALLCQGGFARVNPDGTLGSWQAFSVSGGMSGLLYVRDGDKKIEAHLGAWLNELDLPLYGIREVRTRELVRERYHLDGPFAFALESDGHTAFSDSWHLPIACPLQTLPGYRRATHGYSPEDGPHPVFLCAGPGILPVSLSDVRLVDIAPTAASLLGLSLPQADGIVLPVSA